MKKRTMIALIVAASLIITGGIILVLGLSFAGNNTQKSELIRKDITIQERFDTIAVDTADCDVKFAMFSGRDDCMVIGQLCVVKDARRKADAVFKRLLSCLLKIAFIGSQRLLHLARHIPRQISAVGSGIRDQLVIFIELLRSSQRLLSCKAKLCVCLSLQRRQII